MAERVLQVPERLGDDEPAEVGGEVGQGVSPTAGPWNQVLLCLSVFWNSNLMGKTSVATTHVRLPRPRL